MHTAHTDVHKHEAKRPGIYCRQRHQLPGQDMAPNDQSPLQAPPVDRPPCWLWHMTSKALCLWTENNTIRKISKSIWHKYLRIFVVFNYRTKRAGLIEGLSLCLAPFLVLFPLSGSIISIRGCLLYVMHQHQHDTSNKPLLNLHLVIV